MTTWWVRPFLGALCLAAAAAGVLWYGSSRYDAGIAANEAQWQARMDAASAQARDDSAELQRIANRGIAAAGGYYIKQMERSNAEQRKLKTALAEAGACIVPSDAVGVLDDATKGEHTTDNAGSAATSGQAIAPADSTLGEQLAICQRNYIEVCEPNARERDELRLMWKDAQKVVNVKN